MVKISFVEQTENTEVQAQRFFEHNPCLMTPEELIDKAAKDGYDEDDSLDWDLFKHLMRKYHFQGY